MSWRELVTKNMLRNLRRYIGYLLAAVLAVTVFTMFTAFVDNPDVRNGHMTTAASQLLIVFRVFVALFAIFFIFYFHAALIRARNKEFGLLLTLGVTPRQIGRLIFYESILMGLLAIVVGIVVGIGCSYFFLLAMEAILSIPGAISFTVPITTFSVTTIFFGIIFLLEASWISLHVTRRTPRVLLLGARVQQKPPRASWILVLLGLICVGAAYDMALQYSFAILITMIPIIGLTIIGTYFLFSQCSVMILKRLRQPGISGARLLIVARLAHRMRDYARMLTVVTVLNAIVLTGMGAVFGVLNLIQTQATLIEPFSLQLSTNASHPPSLTPGQVQRELAKQHLNLQSLVSTSLVAGIASGGDQTRPVSIMSLSSFLQLQQAERQLHPEIVQNQTNATALSDENAHLFIPYPEHAPLFKQIQLRVGKVKQMLQVDVGDTRVFNQYHGEIDNGLSEIVVVISDRHYATLARSVPLDHRWQIYSFELPEWQKSVPVVQALRSHLSDAQQSFLTDTVTANVGIEQFLSVMLFADFFVSCLFFLAAGSALYFKLFSQQEEDQRQFHALERIGMQKREIGSLLSREFLLLFFIPVILGIIHSSVALLDLINLFNDVYAAIAIGKVFGIICVIYMACFAVYFWFSRVTYLRRMQLAA
ncbi:MAG TPA: ABC transporter permease [Ktedonobacteraceae bacterium]|nr:ABC transporter permease [Ktedonobacteraceae bacterium]